MSVHHRRFTLRLVIWLFSSIAVGSAAAETLQFQRPMFVASPRFLGQGGSHAATVQGFDSLFTNPAGIGMTTEPQLTLPAMSFWTHARPDMLWSTLGAFGGYSDSADSTAGESSGPTQQELILSVLTKQFTTNGFGIGSALGIGYVGNGLGLGMQIAFDSYLSGRTFPLGQSGEINTQLQFVIGVGRKYSFGDVDLALGAVMRPTLRVASLVDSESAAALLAQLMGVRASEQSDAQQSKNPLQMINALNGCGVGFDTGLIASFRGASVGLQLRDLFHTRMRYSLNTIEQIAGAIAQGGLPASQPGVTVGSYVNPFAMSVGAAYRPDLGDLSYLIDPIVHLQITDPFAWTDQDPLRQRSFWTRVHVGTEVRLLRFLDLRAGINQGYITAGAGMSLLFLDLQFAVFSRELGRYPGDRRSSGVAFEFAFRF